MLRKAKLLRAVHSGPNQAKVKGRRQEAASATQVGKNYSSAGLQSLTRGPDPKLDRIAGSPGISELSQSREGALTTFPYFNLEFESCPAQFLASLPPDPSTA